MSKRFRLYLASQSPRRKELLGYLGIPFDIRPSLVEELSDNPCAELRAQELASLKGKDVFQQLRAEGIRAFVLASDTLVTLDGKFFGKPKNRMEAKRTLQTLSGKTHEVVTGVYFAFLGNNEELKEHSFSVSAKVVFDPIDDYLLNRYLDSDSPYDKAGAYGIQGEAQVFISQLIGPYSTVVGLPISYCYNEMLKILRDEFLSKAPLCDFFH